MRFRPVLHFSDKNESFPCSIQDFVHHSALVAANGETLLAPGRVTMANITQGKWNSPSVTLEVDPMYRFGSPPVNLQDVPFYVNTYRRGDCLYFQYVFLYPDNPGYKFCGCGCCARCLDDHAGDVEHVTVEVRRFHADYSVRRVYFGAHGFTQGLWKYAAECSFADAAYERVRVFVAPHSHACYPYPKRYWRIFGVANDVCNDRGPVWDPVQVRFLHEDAGWNTFRGSLGHKGPPVPQRHAWWKHESPFSITPTKRFFACFGQGKCGCT